MAHRLGRLIGLAAAAIGIAAAAAGAADLRTLTKEIFAVPSTTGNEEMLAAKVRGLLPKGMAVEEDGLGTIAVRLKGAPGRTLLLAPLDGYGHMVSGITPEGVLTLDRPVAPPHARFDAFLLGQPVIITTAKGPVQGVVSQPAMHLLTPERRKLLVDGFSLETAYVDIGVRSEAEARARGIELLDPVTYPAVLTELAGDKWAGPGLGQKALAAVLVSVAEALEGSGAAEETVVAWSAQTKFAARGRGARPPIGAARAKARWQPRRVIAVDVIAAGKGQGPPAGFPVLGEGPAVIRAKAEGSRIPPEAFEKPARDAGIPVQSQVGAGSTLQIPFADLADNTLTVALPVEFLNTPSEIVSLKDLQALRDLLVRFLQPGGAR
ncbi:MAG: peptidase [Candidatus Aminicenantes bacterium]|nr:peptidase [Candidatus Aminicenantes bacterium]